jgi:two-component system, NarL family, nitrate/nitrite response regulator NarL
MSDAVTVLIADDHVPTRTGVRMALERGGLKVVAEAANGDEAVRSAVRLRPQVCLLDVEMPCSGIRAAQQISEALPGAHILMLTVSRDDTTVFEAIRAGAAGYLLKDMDPDTLPDAVRRVAAGEAVLPGRLVRRLVDEIRHNREQPSAAEQLSDRVRVPITPREREVLEMLGERRSTAEMAAKLKLSPITVRRHISALLAKLAVGSREEAGDLLTRNRAASERRRD